MEIQFPPSSLRSMLASPIWVIISLSVIPWLHFGYKKNSAFRPRWPERAYMDILKNVMRSILRRHTSRWMRRSEA